MPSFEVQSGEALEKVAAGQPISWDSFAPDLDGAPSPNRWLLANVAKGLELARRAVAKLASARAAAEDQLQRIARQVASWALWAGEDRSPDYNGMHMRPILGAWVAAETLGLTQVADILRRTFRAMLAHIALSAVPGQARKFSEQELLSPMRAGILRSTGGRSGPRFAVPLAGARGWTKAVVKRADGSLGGRDYWSHLDGDDRGTALEYFARMPIARPTSAMVDVRYFDSFAAARSGGKPLWSVAAQSILTADEVQALRSFLADPRVPERADPLLSWIAAVNAPTSGAEWVRGEHGCATIAATSEPSSTDPAQSAAAYDDGTMEVASSYDGQRKGAAEGRVQFEGLVAICSNSSTPGVVRHDVSRIGEVRYRIHQAPGQHPVRLAADGQPVGRPPSPAPAPVPSPTPQPAPPPSNDHRRPSKRDWIYSPDFLGDLS